MLSHMFLLSLTSLLACGDKDDTGHDDHDHEEADADTDTDTDADTDADADTRRRCPQSRSAEIVEEGIREQIH